jgi:uncharacterized protein RhaS with RHS repeats
MIRLSDGQAIAYDYDAVGNVTNIGDRTTGQGLAFSYDTLDPLTAFAIGGVNQESYTYDAIGDLRTKTGVGMLNYPAFGANSVRP